MEVQTHSHTIVTQCDVLTYTLLPRGERILCWAETLAGLLGSFQLSYCTCWQSVLCLLFSLRWSSPPTLGCIPKQSDSGKTHTGLTQSTGWASIRRHCRVGNVPSGARLPAGGWSPADPIPAPASPPRPSNREGCLEWIAVYYTATMGKTHSRKRKQAHLLITGCFWPTEVCGFGEGREGGKVDRGQMMKSLMCHIN